MLKKIGVCVAWILSISLSVTGQDPQFSQFYAAPLYLNPAFAGATNQNRVGLNYRNQWPAIDANFNTFSAFADFYIESKNSGVGILVNSYTEGVLGLCSIRTRQRSIDFLSRYFYGWITLFQKRMVRFCRSSFNGAQSIASSAPPIILR